MTTKYDLHCHSTFSDGELNPFELLALAKERDITHIALTDHDTLAGIDQAKAAAKEHQIELITGLELSASWRGQLVHVVGLNVDPNNEQLAAGIENNQKLRHERAERMIADFLKHGIDLASELENILNGAIPTRPHFAQALINLGHAKDKKQAFKRFLVRGKPGFIPLDWPDISMVGAWIQAANGTAVLAHPMRYNLTRTKLIALIKDMKEAGILAIEVSTPINTDSQIQMLAQLARTEELYASMGSDFHAPDQPWAKLGYAKPLPEGLTPVWQAFYN